VRIWVTAGGLLAVTLATTGAADARDPLPARASWTASPVAIDESSLDPLEREALAHCGMGEAGLRDVARALVARKMAGEPLPDLDGIAQAQRAAGEPHPWPRAWAAHAPSLGVAPTMDKFDAWIGAPSSMRRCGVASGQGDDGSRSLVVVVVDALADLSPLPARARTGQWLTVEAHLRAPAVAASVIVLDPGGATRTVPSWREGSTIRARFAPEGPGELALQVVADVSGGPRPVLEATVFVDVDPPADGEPQAAPGERAPEGPDEQRLGRMLDGARASVGLPPLPRDSRLDEIARAHARRMAASHELAHDVGDGDPFERLRAAGLDARQAGENVAHASSLVLAHRAVWASASHRMNVLGRAFDRVGIGVARDERGEAWVVETFAGALRP
jgi:uncharacterized protein YkwD